MMKAEEIETVVLAMDEVLQAQKRHEEKNGVNSRHRQSLLEQTNNKENGCPHFTPHQEPQHMQICRVLDFYIQMVQHQPEENEYDSFAGYWFLKDTMGDYDLATNHGFLLLKTMAVSSLLQEENYQSKFHDARLYLSIATKLEAIYHMNGSLKNFHAAVDFHKETCQERGITKNSNSALLHYYQSVLAICTNQGLVDYLMLTPGSCHCLEEWQQQFPMHCDTCGKRPTNTKLCRCSRCKLAKYCSKECQKMDWAKNNHRRYCNKYMHVKGLVEQMTKTP
jgi:MYND finger